MWAWAKLLGAGPADSTMVVYHDRNGDWTGQPDEKVADVALGLADATSGKLVAKSRTDANGRITFRDVPAGPYEVRVYGSWKFRGSAPFITYVGSCRNCQSEMWVTVVPTDNPTPEEEVTPDGETPTSTTTALAAAPAAAPAAPSTGGSGLASTGASVLDLIGLGAVALLGGLGALFWSRRRTA